MSRKRALGFSAAIILAAAGGPAAEGATIVVFDPSGSGGTYPSDINDHGTITGGWFDTTADLGESFIRTSDGTITTFANGGAHPKETSALGLNNNGEITGTDRQHGGLWGFIRSAGGKIRLFQADSTRRFTYVVGINKFGVVTGTAADNHDADRGFVRTNDGTVTLFDVPGDADGTDPTGINARGSIVGDCSTVAGPDMALFERRMERSPHLMPRTMPSLRLYKASTTRTRPQAIITTATKSIEDLCERQTGR